MQTRGGGESRGRPPPFSPTPTALPGEACQCLYCYLICKNGKIVRQRKKKLINTGEQKNRREKEKFVLGEILTAPRRKISIKWSCRTTSIIHTHSAGHALPLTQSRERERKDMQKFSHIQHHIAQQILTHLSLGRREKDNYRIIKEWRQVGRLGDGRGETVKRHFMIFSSFKKQFKS